MRILSDGTVEIKNKRTGELKVIKPQDLGAYGLSTADYIEQAKALQQIPGAVPEGKVLVKEETKPLTEDEKQKQEAASEFKNLALNTVKELRGMKPEELSGGSRFNVFRTAPIFSTDYQTKKAKLDQIKSMLSLENRQLLKGSGSVSDIEVKMLSDASNALKPEMPDKDFVQELAKIQDILEGKYKDPKYSTPISEESKELSRKRNPIIDLLFGGSLDLVKDVQASAVQGSEANQQFQESTSNALALANRIMGMAQKETDPEKKKRYVDTATSLSENIQQDPNDTANAFSSRADVNPALRGLEVGAEVTGIADLVGLLYKGGSKLLAKKAVQEAGKDTITSLGTKEPSLVSKATKVVNDLNPKRILSGKQAEAASKIKTPINVSSLDKAAKNIAVKSADDMAAYRKLIPSIKETNDASKLLENLRYWGEQSFTHSGATKDKATARIASSLYHAGLEELKTVAPEAYKYRQLLRYTFDLPKNVGKVLWKALLAKGVFSGF